MKTLLWKDQLYKTELHFSRQSLNITNKNKWQIIGAFVIKRWNSYNIHYTLKDVLKKDLLTGPIDDSLLRHLSADLGDEWKMLATHLNVKKTRIQSIMRNHVNSENEAVSLFGVENCKSFFWDYLNLIKYITVDKTTYLYNSTPSVCTPLKRRPPKSPTF